VLQRAQLPVRPPYRCLVLKEDQTSRVERVLLDAGSVVRKTYVPRPLFLWRTFLAPSKAKREHDNLQALLGAGVPVSAPLAWDEVRVAGCVPSSILWLEDLGEVDNLKQAFSGPTPHRPRLVSAYARLLRRVHDAGFVSLTAYPRNVLVVAAAAGHLVLCDQPYLVRRTLGVGLAGAAIDLYDAFFTASRTRSLRRSERWRALLAYCGEPAAARAMWRRLVRRPMWWQRFLKGCIKLGSYAGIWSRQA
jgi:hypothetical protein